MSVVAWNCRGATKKDAINRCSEFLRLYKPFILVLLETHATVDQSFAIVRRFGNGWQAEILPREGLSGGLIFAWQSYMLSVDIHVRSRQVMHSVVARRKNLGFFQLCQAI